MGIDEQARKHIVDKEARQRTLIKIAGADFLHCAAVVTRDMEYEGVSSFTSILEYEVFSIHLFMVSRILWPFSTAVVTRSMEFIRSNILDLNMKLLG